MQYHKGLIFILTIFFIISATSQAEILFKDNFEGDAIDNHPKNWAVGHKGLDDSKVIWDPDRPKHRVFSSPTERHDAKGAVYITGKGKANPIATILSFSMALRYSLDLDKEADNLDKAVQKVLDEGLRTKDILSKGKKEVSTSQMGDAIISKLK